MKNIVWAATLGCLLSAQIASARDVLNDVTFHDTPEAINLYLKLSGGMGSIEGLNSGFNDPDAVPLGSITVGREITPALRVGLEGTYGDLYAHEVLGGVKVEF